MKRVSEREPIPRRLSILFAIVLLLSGGESPRDLAAKSSFARKPISRLIETKTGESHLAASSRSRSPS